MTAEIAHPAVSIPDVYRLPLSHALAGLGRSAFTLLITPPHEKLHQVLEAGCMEGPHQPLIESPEATSQKVHDTVLAHANLSFPKPVDTARLVNLSGLLIQFADYTPVVHNNVRVPYAKITDLQQAICERAAENGPLGFAEQLQVALERTHGDLTEAMWRLVVTSRLNARWLDSKAIDGMPDMTAQEKVQHMRQWRAAIAACKPPQEGLPQDPSGDVYYAWTHAFAKYLFTLAPRRETRVTRAATAIFHHGTSLMHKVIHTFNKQGVESNHTIAANYGNLIGQACIDAVRGQTAHA